MVLLCDFSVGRHDLNPQNSTLFLRFKSDARLELTQNPSFVDEHLPNKRWGKRACFPAPSEPGQAGFLLTIEYWILVESLRFVFDIHRQDSFNIQSKIFNFY
jgi:hypothetical protein